MRDTANPKFKKQLPTIHQYIKERLFLTFSRKMRKCLFHWKGVKVSCFPEKKQKHLFHFAEGYWYDCRIFLFQKKQKCLYVFINVYVYVIKVDQS
jgi:hypothetical protein